MSPTKIKLRANFLTNKDSLRISEQFNLTLSNTDYPNMPSDINITRPVDTNSIRLSWTAPPISTAGFVLIPLDGYIIQTRNNRKAQNFTDLMELGAGVTEVNVTGLFPGTEYNIRVVSVNQAGRTPSESISITTVADGELNPRLFSLFAVASFPGSPNFQHSGLIQCSDREVARAVTIVCSLRTTKW